MKKVKGKSDINEETESLEENHSYEDKKDPAKSKKVTESSPEIDPKLKSAKRKGKGGVVQDDSEDSAVGRGKRPKLDESLVDSADNDSVITGSDYSEVSKSSRRSRLRGLENSNDWSETESITSASADLESSTVGYRSKSRRSKEDTVSKASKRKIKENLTFS